MIQYDRTTGTFAPNEETNVQVESDACRKLNIALLEVKDWLNLKRRCGRYSHGFLIELTINSFDRLFHIHAVYDEIGKLEGSDITPSMTKTPRQMRKPLRGFWHKHYFQASFMVKNLKDESEKMQRDGRWENMFAPHYGKHLYEFIDQVSHEMVDQAYERRARDRRITGEFIVYEPQADGSNYYLTMGKHGEWDAIRTRVDDYKRFDLGES